MIEKDYVMVMMIKLMISFVYQSNLALLFKSSGHETVLLKVLKKDAKVQSNDPTSVAHFNE